MNGHTLTSRHDSVTKPNRTELMRYANGHVVAAASATSSVTKGRFGISAPMNATHGPSAEMPINGTFGSNGDDVSISEIVAATTISNAMPNARIVRELTTRYRCIATSPNAINTDASSARRFTGLSMIGTTFGCANRSMIWIMTTTITRTTATIESRFAASSISFGGSPAGTDDPLLVSGVASTGGGLDMCVFDHTHVNPTVHTRHGGDPVSMLETRGRNT